MQFSKIFTLLSTAIVAAKATDTQAYNNAGAIYPEGVHTIDNNIPNLRVNNDTYNAPTGLPSASPTAIPSASPTAIPSQLPTTNDDDYINYINSTDDFTNNDDSKSKKNWRKKALNRGEDALNWSEENYKYLAAAGTLITFGAVAYCNKDKIKDAYAEYVTGHPDHTMVPPLDFIAPDRDTENGDDDIQMSYVEQHFARQASQGNQIVVEQI